jgi:hypothetical protein
MPSPETDGENKSMIKIKIDVTKITKSRLFKGKEKDGKSPMYLNAILLETKQSSFGDWRDDQTHMIVEDCTKEERAAGVKGAIIGNATDMRHRRTNDQPPADPNDHLPGVPGDQDEIPF